MNNISWFESVLQTLAGLSRTLKGFSDTSSAAEKPKLRVEEGSNLTDSASQNLQCALEFLWENRKQRFASATEVRQFVDAVARQVSEGLLQVGQPLYRTWETNFRQTAPENVEQEYQSFCRWLFGALESGDPIETAAIIEKRLDGEIHPFADGCGRTAKILAAFVLLRAGCPPVRYRSRKEYYKQINASDKEWVRYYRTLGAERRTLAVLVAKGGLVFQNVLPPEWERVVVDYSRLDLRSVELWTKPAYTRYDEIVIVDRGVVTGLTQCKVAQALHKLGVEGQIKFAGQAKALLGFLHQDYIITPEGNLVPRSEISPSKTLNDQYLLAIVGLPATGKTMLRKILAGVDSFSVYKWGETAAEVISELYGDRSLESVARFTHEVEEEDRVYLAREFLTRTPVQSDPTRFVVVDGIKRREQIIFVSYTLKRPVIVVKVCRDEKERVREAHQRGDIDDEQDAVRLELLRAMGAIDMANFADFVVDTTRMSVSYDEEQKTCTVGLTPKFLSACHEIFSWLLLSDSLGATRGKIVAQCRWLGESRGYKTSVEVKNDHQG